MPSVISAGTSSNTALNFSGDTSGVLQLASNTGTAALTIDTAQNVGIGTASPGSKLAILESTNGNSILNIRNTNAGSSATSIIALGNDGALNGAYLVLNSSTNTAGGAGNSLNITNGFNAPMTFATNNAERMRINADGTIRVVSTIGVGNATPSTSGAGITFPATQSASSNANTLDDYEEGTWTPTAFGENSAGTTTYNLQQGSYTKIGRLVTVSARIDYSSLTGTGTLLLGGLPFASANDQMEYIGSIMTSGLNWTAGTQIALYMPGNTTNVSIFNIGDDIGWGNQQCVNEVVGMRYTITYFAA